MAKGKGSKKVSTYNETVYARNRQRKLARHLKKFPNDTVAEKRLANGTFKIRRKKPISPNGWTQSAFKGVPKDIRATLRTKTECVAYAKLLKVAKYTNNVLRHMPKTTKK